MLRYRVKLSKDINDTILVEVPDVPGAVTFGAHADVRNPAGWATGPPLFPVGDVKKPVLHLLVGVLLCKSPARARSPSLRRSASA